MQSVVCFFVYYIYAYWKVIPTIHLQMYRCMAGCVGAVWVVRGPVSVGPILTQAAEQRHSGAVFDSQLPVTDTSPIHRPHHHQPQCTRILLSLVVPHCTGVCCGFDLLILILMFPVNQARYAAAWPATTTTATTLFKVHEQGGHSFMHLLMRAKLLSIFYI